MSDTGIFSREAPWTLLGSEFFSPNEVWNDKNLKFGVTFYGENGKGYLVNDISKVIGWFPAAGTIVGIARALFATHHLLIWNQLRNSPDADLKNEAKIHLAIAQRQFIRAGLELLELGPILALIDIIMTLGRLLVASRKEKNLTKGPHLAT